MLSSPLLAHAPGHDLVEHLRCVAELARQHAPVELKAVAALAGRWHDLGKFRPGFQHYIRLDPDTHVEGRALVSADKTHSAAGALQALHVLQQRHGDLGRRVGWLLAHLIAAHHAGLYDHDQLIERLQGSGSASCLREWAEATQVCQAHEPALLEPPADLEPRQLLLALPGLRQQQPLAQALALRMLFSALVDADFLDTEAYLDAGRNSRRAGFMPLADYRNRLRAHLDGMADRVRAAGRHDDPVMTARSHVLAQCRAAAGMPPGVFSLQVPTGGGKTLASLSFALDHALAHGLERVIIAIPYTSIVEQTADVLAQVFGRDAVVEHHSQADDGDGAHGTARTRLACENWDAPLIVTTNVQLLESLFASRTSRCRKLHRLQRSVIVLDEAQVLPPPFLQPTLDALHLLSAHYGSTLVSCTATQPVLTDIQRFDPRRSLRGLVRGGARPVQIVPDADALYQALQRVQLHWPGDLQTERNLSELAADLALERSVLAIVNTRRDAADLLQALDARVEDDGRALHLSAAMCGQHRADTIAHIRLALQTANDPGAAPLRVVSTQLVEAGVDLDFPVVQRALAGLDSIAQAAGRCNREGRMGHAGGRVSVFVRPIPAVLSSLRRAAEATRAVLGAERPPTLTPTHFQRYFEQWYGRFDSLDERGIGDMLRTSQHFDLRLRSAADAYRLVDDEDQCSVIVPYQPVNGDTQARDAALAALQRGDVERWQLRALQRYVVQAPRRTVTAWQQTGEVSEPLPGWYILRNELLYDSRRGLLPNGALLDAGTLVQ
jgi:CRISPR-associated endonuclease/helicase Cas3